MRAITKERLQQIVHAAGLEPCDYEEVFDGITTGEIVAMARQLLAGMEQEPVAWRSVYHENHGLLTGSKNVLASWERMGWDCQPLYAAPQLPQPAVGDGRDQFEEWFKFHHGDEHSIIKLHRANGGANYRDPHVDLAWIAWKDSRAAMLQGAEPVTTAYKLPASTPCKDAPEHIWLQTAGVWPENGEFSELTWCSDNQHEDDTLYVRADIVGGNSPVIPDGWVACSERMPEENAEQEVIACFKGGDISTLYYFKGRWDDAYGIVPIRHDVTHWMPLQAAPQQEVK